MMETYLLTLKIHRCLNFAIADSPEKREGAEVTLFETKTKTQRNSTE